jgi:hypothetical protein
MLAEDEKARRFLSLARCLLGWFTRASSENRLLLLAKEDWTIRRNRKEMGCAGDFSILAECEIIP